MFPESVKNIKHPVFEGGKLIRTEDIVAVNYQSLIPVLIKAVQEQQVVINELKKQVNSLRGKPVTKGTGSAASLAQAVPNPVNATTSIKYSIPSGVQQASIEIYDVSGNKVLQFKNLRGASQVVVNGRQLQAGTYVYRLVMEGQETISNKFVVAKGS